MKKSHLKLLETRDDGSTAVSEFVVLEDGDKDYDTPCINCGEVPTVYPTGLCGPCCFGEAETARGNW